LPNPSLIPSPNPVQRELCRLRFGRSADLAILSCKLCCVVSAPNQTGAYQLAPLGRAASGESHMCLQGSGPALETFYKTRSEIMWFHVEAICTAGPPSQRPWRNTYRRYRIACPSLRFATVTSGPSVCVKPFRIGGTMHPLLTRQLEPSSASNAIHAPSSVQCKSQVGVAVRDSIPALATAS
jgi:hypothetical protein